MAELENRNAELERFNYTLSHELKTPLVTLGFYSGALQNDIKLDNQERVSADLTHHQSFRQDA